MLEEATLFRQDVSSWLIPQTIVMNYDDNEEYERKEDIFLYTKMLVRVKCFEG